MNDERSFTSIKYLAQINIYSDRGSAITPNLLPTLMFFSQHSFFQQIFSHLGVINDKTLKKNTLAKKRIDYYFYKNIVRGAACSKQLNVS
jgi:hypothetical protein